VHVHSGESSDEMLFKCCDGPFCSVDSMVVRQDKLDVDFFRPDVLLYCGRTLMGDSPLFWG